MLYIPVRFTSNIIEDAQWVGVGEVHFQLFRVEITQYCIWLQANGTFDALARLKELADLWDEVGPWDFLQDSPQVNNLRVRQGLSGLKAAPFNGKEENKVV